MEIKTTLQVNLDSSLQIIREYDWLINAYVLDFYVDNHWEKLPKAWTLHFENLPPEQLCYLLDDGSSSSKCTWPLSILALKAAMQKLCIERRRSNSVPLPSSSILNHPKLKHIFNKGVKPKKRHEIETMASLCQNISEDIPVDFIVDFGAGLGHLARTLAYGYNIKMCCLEMQTKLNQQACEMDNHMDKLKSKYANDILSQKPEHVDLCLTADMSPEDFLNTIETALRISSKQYRFGIIGLHPCGDLGPILMRMFLKCDQAKFLNFVGCCYMKMTTQDAPSPSNVYGYPMSEYLREKPTLSKLSYEAREISCHAIELYNERLSLKDYEYLKVHSFRAATERMIRKYYPKYSRTRMNNVKYVPGMNFAEYFYKAVKGLPCEKLPSQNLETSSTENDLRNWKNIVIFYTLRLFFAPLIESVILYDRMLYLMENDCQVQINAIFDPRLSPRNHITTAMKLR